MEEANQRETIDSGNRWRQILKDKEVRCTKLETILVLGCTIFYEMQSVRVPKPGTR